MSVNTTAKTTHDQVKVVYVQDDFDIQGNFQQCKFCSWITTFKSRWKTWAERPSSSWKYDRKIDDMYAEILSDIH